MYNIFDNKEIHVNTLNHSKNLPNNYELDVWVAKHDLCFEFQVYFIFRNLELNLIILIVLIKIILGCVSLCNNLVLSTCIY